MPITMYHNPRCSKSRATLALLQQHHQDIHLIEYLINPPNKEQLQQILTLLKLTPEQLIRKNETLYKELTHQPSTHQQWLELLITYPKLIERPIVFTTTHACIGRPPENILTLLAAIDE